MYESNYSYEEYAPKKEKKGVGRTVALLLAVAVVGGASGFGGSYLQKKLDPQISTAAADTSSAGAADTAAADTAAADTVKTDDTKVSVQNMLSTPNTQNGELSLQQIVKKVSPSIVSVHSQFGNSGGTGSGIILSEEGYIITNAHVVENETQEYVAGDGYSDPYGGYGNGFGGYGDIFNYFFNNGGSYRTVKKKADKVTIVLSDDSETEYEAEIIGADSDSDIAVLKIDPQGKTLTAAEFGDSGALQMGDTAAVIGYPLGLGLTVTDGVISGLNRNLDVELSTGGAQSITLIQTSAAINPGNSGGALVNGYGQVVGISSSKLQGSQVDDTGFAIPISDAMPIISDLMNNGYVINRTPQIGITGSTINSAIQRYYDLPVSEGVMIVSVGEGSAAEEAGLAAYDVIIAADGQKVTSMEDLTEIKSKHQIGDTMTVTIARNNGDKEVTITLKGDEEAQQ